MTDTGLPDKPTVTFSDIEVEQGKAVAKTAEFTASYLKVMATKQGKPFRAHVWVYPEGEKSYLVQKDTGKDQPAVFQLLPGIYDVKVEDFTNRSIQEFKSVIIESGKTKIIEAAF